jgi:hypothetical protein
MTMEMDWMKTQTEAQATSLRSALPKPLDAYYHELWTCGRCNREFGDCTSCVAHEQQCGGQLDRW